VLDIVNYGVENYWATPREFAINDGDCKDYAIAKYFTLRKLGWREDDLRIVVLQDMNLDEAHAITVAYSDNTAYVLDNLLGQVVRAAIIHHYHPFYSINETGWWLHVVRR
jgi:predicted transglutaminase-like cysteine proteinase